MKQKFNITKIKIISYCFLIAFIILTLTSKSSFIYPFNDWVDANAFFTTGKAMFNGVVPYKDLFEQKGILLYFIYGIGYLISHKTFIGIFIIEVIFMSTTLYYAYNIITLFTNKLLAITIIPIFASIICTTDAFTHGGGAEELCLPFLMLTLYYYLDYFKNNNLSNKRLIIAGLCAGSIFLIKYTLLGFWFAFMATIFFDLFFQKKYKESFLSCLYFLLGMFTPIIIALIYLGIHHAISDFIRVYFKINMTSYGIININIFLRLLNAYLGFIKTCFFNNIFIIILLLGLPLFILKLDISKKGKINIIITYLLTILGIYWGLKFYHYYIVPTFIFTLISLIAIGNLLVEKKIKIPKYIPLITILLAILFAFQFANYKEMRFIDKNDLYQYKFAKIIAKSSEKTLLNIGSLDCGLYTTTGIIPTTYFFEKQNFDYQKFPDNIDSFNEYLKNKETKYVVYVSRQKLNKIKKQEKNLFNNYYLISEEKQQSEHHLVHAYLFERK